MILAPILHPLASRPVADLPANQFRVSLTPTTLSLKQGETGDIAVALTLIAGVAEVGDFSVSGLPPGVTGEFAVLDPSTDGGDATLTLTVAPDADAVTLDSFIVQVAAASQTKRRGASVTVELNDFSVDAEDGVGLTLEQGGTLNFDIALNLVSGNAVTTSSIVVSGLPAGVNATVADQTISTNGGITSITLDADPDADLATLDSFTVTVTTADVVRADTGTLTVTAATGGGGDAMFTPSGDAMFTPSGDLMFV